MPAKAGPPPHVHDQGEEVFYILDGEMALQLGNQVVTGTSGQLVRIPAGTPHAFAVRTETARVLNFYVPGRPRPADRHARHASDQPRPAPARSTATTDQGAGARVRPAPARPGHTVDVRAAGPPGGIPEFGSPHGSRI